MHNIDNVAPWPSIARKITTLMDETRRAFLTMPVETITAMLRKETGNPRARLTSRAGAALDAELVVLGFSAFPAIRDAGSSQVVRVYRVGTRAWCLLEAIVRPTLTNGRLLATLGRPVRRFDGRSEGSSPPSPEQPPSSIGFFGGNHGA